ncbi:MAG: PAS domain-containing sensor histidine kinase [Bacteroidales bacterium]|nr:PAS domain-containing sensor histidine kinase [Bacteroidales bacterium]MBN2817904.1 PAS domain-containing sensor histidine kinase [Bacteroidales bacterium]
MERSREELEKELENLKARFSELESRKANEVEELKTELRELRHKQMFLEGIANSTFDGFLVVNPYGQKILQNQRTVELWKIPKEIVEDPDGRKQVAHVMHMTVNPKQFVDEIDYLREHPNDKSRDELELIDGTVLDRYSSPVIGSDGENYGRIWTFHDITERKKFEKHLTQLNADKDRFISILSHDLRSPFNTLLGFSELLKNKMDSLAPEKLRIIVDSIFKIAKNTHNLLEDTLLWASIQSKKINFTPIDFNLYDLVKEVVDILDPSAKAKQIEIKNNLDSSLKICADVYMMKAIFRNLVSNAIKFTDKKGTIRIEAQSDKKTASIKVIDNGVGIDQDALKKLFYFASIQSTTGTANELGTGMGLLLCKEFVEKHNGTIRIDSTENKGTTVDVSIPL